MSTLESIRKNSANKNKGIVQTPLERSKARVFPKRTKAYPLHRDMFTFLPEPGAQLATMGHAAEAGTKSLSQFIEKNRPLIINKPRYLYTKVKATFNNPQCLYFVLDALCDSARGLYIRPAYMVPIMRGKAPQFYWDVGMVGRMVAGIEAAAYDDYAPHGYVSESKWIPFVSGRDGRGRFYIVDPQNGDEGLLWLMAFRRIAYDLSIKSMEADELGKIGSEHGNEMVPADYYSSLSPGAIRAVGGFQGQLRPGEYFRPAMAPIDDNPHDRI